MVLILTDHKLQELKNKNKLEWVPTIYNPSKWRDYKHEKPFYMVYHI